MRELGILAVFILTVSMAIILPARADTVPSPGTTLLTQFVPSGPASDSIEYFVICKVCPFLQTGQVDLTDSPLPTSLVPSICQTGTGIECTSSLPPFCSHDPCIASPQSPDVEFGFRHNDFNLANDFWGITMCFGQDNIVAGGPCTPQHGAVTIPGYAFTTATCPNVPTPHTGDCTFAGIQWRQGFAQLLNKDAYVQSGLSGGAEGIDNLGTSPAQHMQHSGEPFDDACAPTPPTTCVGSYNTGTPANYNLKGVCSWDFIHTPTPPYNNCISALKYPGSLTSSDGYSWNAGTTNFCDAADHFIAAGIAAGKDANCRLTTLLGPGGNVVFNVRSDSPDRHTMGNAVFNRFCDLLNAPVISILRGSQCSRATNTGATLTLTTMEMTITDAFSDIFTCGFGTIATFSGCPNLDWHLYTGANSGGPAFNQQWALYNSDFAAICGVTSSINPAVFLPNYVYSCNTKLDHYNSMVANNATITSARQALQVAMEIFGNHTISAPTLSRIQVFAFLKGWQGVSDAAGVGIARGNFWTLMNMWNPSPLNSGPIIRWGMDQAFSSLNPFLASTVFDTNVLQEIYDPLLALTPYIPLSGPQIIGYMANNYQLVSHNGLVGATDLNCPTSIRTLSVGGCVKISLRGDISFQDGVQVTASDVKFSYENFNATGGLFSAGAPNTVDIVFDPKVLPTSLGGTEAPGQPEILYIALHTASALSLLDLVSVPIVPQHLWKTMGVLGPCKDMSISTPGSGKDSPQCTVDPAFLTDPVLSDPVASNKLIGSGAFECISGDGSVVGGGCTPMLGICCTPEIILTRFGSGLSPQAPTGSNAGSVYFRSNADYKQFLWASAGSQPAGLPGSCGGPGNCVDGFALAADLACPRTATPNFCAAYNSPDAVVTCVSSAGLCLGSAAGGAGLASPTHSDFVGYASQIVRWVGTVWNSPFLYSNLDGAQPAPTTLYEDGSQYS